MSLTVAILIILLGLILLLLEILVIPGIIVGIIGVLLSIGGIISVYVNQGNTAGNMVLLGTLVSTAIMIYFTFRSNTWKKVSINTSIDGKVNTFNTEQIKAGETGVAISRLAPSGKALVNGIQVEVHSMEGYINEGTSIIIAKVDENKIIVKSKS